MTVTRDVDARLDEALDLARTRPDLALELVADIPDAPRTRGIRRRIQGTAALARGDIAGALDHLAAAVEIAGSAGLGREAARARMSLAAALAAAGRMEAALATADVAARALRGADADRLRSQRTAILVRLGRAQEAVAASEGVPLRLAAADDPIGAARAHTNRGIAYAFCGRMDEAEAEIRRARAIYTDAGRSADAAGEDWNLGWIAMMRGDLVTAHRRLGDAAARFDDVGLHPGGLRLDQAELFLRVRLLDEAAAAADMALEQFRRGGAEGDVAEALLVRARVVARRGDRAAARRTLRDAAGGFARQGRATWRALAEQAALALDDGDPAERALRAEEVADELDRAGLQVAAATGRIVAARAATEAGRHAHAERLLQRARWIRDRGPAGSRVDAWFAAAQHREAVGDDHGAVAAIDEAFDALETVRATLGAAELRAAATGYADDLARFAFSLALRHGDERLAFDWSERYRAAALRWRSARPPEDRVLADRLAELRLVAQQVHDAISDGIDPDPLHARQARLEREVRELTWRAAGGAAAVEPATTATVVAHLGHRRLIAFQTVGDVVIRLVLGADGHPTATEIGSAAEIAGEVRGLRFALRRLLVGHGGDRTRALMRAEVTDTAGRLDALLLGDRTVAREGPVIVPTGALHGLPWGLLPSLADAAPQVAPSASLWLASVQRERRGQGVFLAGGPELEHAEGEIAAIARRVEGAEVRLGAEATVGAVSEALSRCAVAHLACHGRFRADNPLFSSLLLADGSLTVYELERLGACPSLVVLPACDAGSAAVGGGDEVAGIAAALLGMGASAVVAPVLPVPDRETRSLMVAFHAALTRGQGPAAALSAAARATGVTNVFCCFGAG